MSSPPVLRPMAGDEIAHWYECELQETFPETECKPLAEILALCRAGRYELLGLYDGQILLGYATLLSSADYPDYVLLDYLGVTAARRNGGLGAEILRQIGLRFAGRAAVITEAETPIPGAAEADNALRRRRIAFYERCGFQQIYDCAACGMRFRALALCGTPPDLAAMAVAHRALYGAERTDVCAPLSPGQQPRPPHWMQKET